MPTVASTPPSAAPATANTPPPAAPAAASTPPPSSAPALDAAAAHRELRRLMEYATGKLGTRTNLTSAILAVTPRDPKRVVVEHPFGREFLVTPLAETEARTYLCGQGATAATGAQYFGVVFQFRRAGGGTLGLLWTREAGRWKLVSFQPIAQ